MLGLVHTQLHGWAEVHLLLLPGLLQGSASGVEYEQRRFRRAVPQGADTAAALPKTAAWLRNVFRMVRAAASSGVVCSPTFKASVCRVCQTCYSFPDTQCNAPCTIRCGPDPDPEAACWHRPQEDVLLQHVSGEQLVFDAVVEGVLQLLQVGQPLLCVGASGACICASSMQQCRWAAVHASAAGQQAGCPAA
jgi:hypothetical protein